MFSKIKHYAVAHKIITVVVLVIIAWGAYAAYANSSKPATVTKYVVEDAAQGTVIASVSGSGQVQADTTVDVKPQNSETVTKIYVQPGDHVTAGQALIQMDTTNEAKAVQQAQLSLQSAQLSLAKLQEISTTTLLQDQDSLATGQASLLNASTSLANDYGNGFDTIAATFVDLQSLMTDLNNFVSGTQVDKVHANPDAYVNLMPTYLQASTQPYRNQLVAAYTAAAAAYQQNLVDYHATTRTSSQATLAALFKETYTTANLIDTTVKGGTDLLDYVVDNYPSGQAVVALPAITTTYQTDFGNYTNSINSDLSGLSGIMTTITNDEQALTNQEASLNQASTSYTELVAGPDPLDVESQNISIENAQMSLQTAEQNLSYDTVTAPISGIVATMPSVVGETVASPAATIVSDNEIAEVTLNEIDAAKVQLGDKATLTFDAFPDLSLAGTVVELDPVGTVSQGVVNYNVQIGFSQPTDTSSTELVKPGMSVTADIVTQADQNVIAIPNGAVHTTGTGATASSYVLEPATPLAASDVAASANGGIQIAHGTTMVPVTIGITNDTLTEIDSGVNVGDQIITQTITAAASTASTAAGGTSALRALGVGGAGGAGAAAGGGARVFTGGAGGGGFGGATGGRAGAGG